MPKTGLEILRDSHTTADEIAVIFRDGHPPFESHGSVPCDYVTCKECWLAWLTTGERPVPKEGELSV